MLCSMVCRKRGKNQSRYPIRYSKEKIHSYRSGTNVFTSCSSWVIFSVRCWTLSWESWSRRRLSAWAWFVSRITWAASSRLSLIIFFVFRRKRSICWETHKNFNQSINQSVSQSINQSINQSVNQSIVNRSINQSINQLNHQPPICLTACTVSTGGCCTDIPSAPEVNRRCCCCCWTTFIKALLDASWGPEVTGEWEVREATRLRITLCAAFGELRSPPLRSRAPLRRPVATADWAPFMGDCVPWGPSWPAGRECMDGAFKERARMDRCRLGSEPEETWFGEFDEFPSKKRIKKKKMQTNLQMQTLHR